MAMKDKEYLDKLGPIMPASIKPVHVGWYARDYSANPDGPGYWLMDRDYWDGENWYVGIGAGIHCRHPDATPVERWRGLAEKPE